MTPPLGPAETIIMYVALALGIMLCRFLPFAVFARRSELPPRILRLGAVLPHAAMTLLLVYCLKDVRWLDSSHGAPELLAMAGTACLHLVLKNVLISIAAGTIGYMALVQMVF